MTTITRKDIQALRSAAIEHRDTAQRIICDIALDGVDSQWDGDAEDEHDADGYNDYSGAEDPAACHSAVRLSQEEALAECERVIQQTRFLIAEQRLSRLYDLRNPPSGSDAIAYIAVTVDANDDDICAAVLAEINKALGRDFQLVAADWTGNGNGDESDIAIYAAATE